MLTLVLEARLSAGLLSFLDKTPNYDAVLAPGGYGGPNPGRLNTLLVGVVGRQQAGQFRFAETVYGDNLQFRLSTPGVYVAYLLSVLMQEPLATAPANTLWVASDGRLMRKLSATSLLGAEEFQFSHYSLDELRDLQPPVLAVAEAMVPVLFTGTLERQLDELLLDFVRRATGAYPRGVEQLAGPWLQASATLASVEILVRENRYPEAAQHLAGLQQQIGFDALTSAPLPSAGQTDWLSTQLR